MKTILPKNTILARANTVTVDAEKFAQLNNITDIELREKLGEAFARLVKTYLAHVIKENPDFTVGQALQVINMTADDIRSFIGTELEDVDEYEPDMFPPEDNSNAQPEENNEAAGLARKINEKPAEPVDDRGTRLFNSFGHKRNKMRRQ